MERARNWRFLLPSSFVFVIPSLLSITYPCCKFTYAIDTLLPGQFLNGYQSLVSKNGVFKLGYKCPSPYAAYCGLGIWFANSSGCDRDYLPVWQPANQDRYSPDYKLSFSEDGVLSLTLRDYSYPIWSSPNMTSTSISAVAVLLDSGNLIVRDQVNSSIVIWQSFDSPYPLNILLGGSLGLNTITNEKVILFSYSNWLGDPFMYYSLALDTTRRRGFTIQRNGELIFASTFPRWMDIREDGGYGLTFNDMRTYIQLDSSGVVRLTKRGECNSTLWSAPETVCDLDSYCGPYSLCTMSGSCKCPAGFGTPWMEGWVAVGCSRKVHLDGESTAAQPEDVFYPIDGIHRYPRGALVSETTNMNRCQSSCLRNSACSAFAYNRICLLWFGELRNTVVLDSGSNGDRLYIRIATEQQQACSRAASLFSSQKKVVFALVFGALALIAIGLIFLWRYRRKLFEKRRVNGDGSLMIFSFVQIKDATKGFSEKLGEGGFGCVFRAMLPGCTVVAVKKLKGLRQEEKQFRAEVQTIGMIQHINIVRLLGFCAEGSRRFLVYEYMANGSLSNYLFSKGSSKLSWELRYSTALGIARGLAYLHEGCEDCILHCDIKPDNVLLDAEFCPKIADFGMAKLLDRDFSRALTTMRGTIGYLAPEWISGIPITHKADVYSYGTMLLEIISGRRNSEKIKEGKLTYFPTYAAVKLNEEEDVMCLLDGSLEGNADAEQVKRACRVACWCIQDAEDCRPMMGQVVRMLEGVMDVEVPPVPLLLQKYIGMEDTTSGDSETVF